MKTERAKKKRYRFDFPVRTVSKDLQNIFNEQIQNKMQYNTHRTVDIKLRTMHR